MAKFYTAAPGQRTQFKREMAQAGSDERCKDGAKGGSLDSFVHRRGGHCYHWMIERMNWALKRYHHDNHDRIKSHLSDFVDACNFVRKLKTLNRLTMSEYT